MKGKTSTECLMPLKMFLSRESKRAFSILREAPGMSAELELEGVPFADVESWYPDAAREESGSLFNLRSHRVCSHEESQAERKLI